MLFNYNFAMSHNLPVDSFYSVAPHHSGVYPVYDALYELWSDIWLIKATSTEGYPHLKPAYFRKGFVHKTGIKVMPRQTCGIFTHTQFLDKYPRGIKQLESNIEGGELFKTVLLNKVLVFMTHMTNYGNDRIGLFLFKKLFDFVSEWTNIKFVALPPVKLVEKHFELYPDDLEPLWTNPCKDKRHVAIWHQNSSACKKFPKLIIIGPQKTGSTALYTYLKLHPLYASSRITPLTTFEETQFFTNKNYYRGIDWLVLFYCFYFLLDLLIAFL